MLPPRDAPRCFARSRGHACARTHVIMMGRAAARTTTGWAEGTTERGRPRAGQGWAMARRGGRNAPSAPCERRRSTRPTPADRQTQPQFDARTSACQPATCPVAPSNCPLERRIDGCCSRRPVWVLAASSPYEASAWHRDGTTAPLEPCGSLISMGAGAFDSPGHGTGSAYWGGVESSRTSPARAGCPQTRRVCAASPVVGRGSWTSLLNRHDQLRLVWNPARPNAPGGIPGS